MIKEIKTTTAPAAIYLYSQGTDNGQLVIVSGQLSINVTTGEFAGNNIASQTMQSLENVKSILAASSLTMAEVMKSTVYLASMDDFKEMDKVYSDFVLYSLSSKNCFSGCQATS